MISSPQTEWPAIAVEPTTPGALYSGYIVPLALITPICSFVSEVVFQHRSLFLGSVVFVVAFVMELIAVYIVALLAEALAPSFNGVRDRNQALKWIAYSYTPRWIAGIATLIPGVGALIALLGSLFSLYLLYLGAVPVMRVPSEKAAGFTIVVILASIVLFVVIGFALGIIIAFLAAGAILTTRALH